MDRQNGRKDAPVHSKDVQGHFQGEVKFLVRLSVGHGMGGERRGVGGGTENRCLRHRMAVSGI